MTGPPDVIIVGGGVIGLTTAYFLAKERVSVAVVDQAEPGRQASWAGAGIIPPGCSSRIKTPYDALRAHSAEMYPELSQELRERTGIDNGYVVCGGLEVVDHAEEAPLDAWQEEGITFERWHAARLRDSLPQVSPALDSCYFLPGMAQVRNPRHLKALAASCRLLGVQICAGYMVLGFERQGCKITAIRTSNGQLSAGQFLIATGAWTDALLKEVGWQPGVRPVRGQIALLSSETPLRHILLWGKRYIVPRLDGRVLVGSTEEEAGFDARPTAQAIAGLLAFAVDAVPGFAGAVVERCWAGLRPGTADGLPYVGRVPDVANLFVAAGHFRAGIQLSPATGVVMKQIILGQKPLVPLDAFRLDRPVTAAPAKVFAS
jgi:glycine oxidase